MISGDAYLAKKESKERDCLNGYTYFKFLNAGLNIGYTLKSKNKEKRKILNFDLSIFEFGYSNNYFSISFALGLNPIDVSEEVLCLYVVLNDPRYKSFKKKLLLYLWKKVKKKN